MRVRIGTNWLILRLMIEQIGCFLFMIWDIRWDNIASMTFGEIILTLFIVFFGTPFLLILMYGGFIHPFIVVFRGRKRHGDNDFSYNDWLGMAIFWTLVLGAFLTAYVRVYL